MTREETINLLSQMRKDGEGFLSDNTIEAYDMAIEALQKQSCEDCISREAVLEAIDVKAWEFCDYLIRNGRNDEQKPVSHFADNLRECVGEDLPSVTAQPKMGYWFIDERPESDREVVCSNCDKPIFKYHKLEFDYRPKYCPNCGAKMSEIPTGEEVRENE